MEQFSWRVLFQALIRSPRLLGWSLLVTVAILILFSCKQTNRAPAAYMKDVVAYKEGMDAIAVYFVLADKTGVPTTGFGTYVLKVYETKREWSSITRELEEKEYLIHVELGNIVKSDFYVSEVGKGAFQHDLLLCSLGRITYPSFHPYPTETFGKVVVTYHPNGNLIKQAEKLLAEAEEVEKSAIDALGLFRRNVNDLSNELLDCPKGTKRFTELTKQLAQAKIDLDDAFESGDLNRATNNVSYASYKLQEVLLASMGAEAAIKEEKAKLLSVGEPMKGEATINF